MNYGYIRYGNVDSAVGEPVTYLNGRKTVEGDVIVYGTTYGYEYVLEKTVYHTIYSAERAWLDIKERGPLTPAQIAWWSTFSANERGFTDAICDLDDVETKHMTEVGTITS